MKLVEIYKLRNEKFIDLRVTVTQDIPLILLLMLSRYFFTNDSLLKSSCLILKGEILIALLFACSLFSADFIILFENLDDLSRHSYGRLFGNPLCSW